MQELYGEIDRQIRQIDRQIERKIDRQIKRSWQIEDRWIYLGTIKMDTYVGLVWIDRTQKDRQMDGWMHLGIVQMDSDGYICRNCMGRQIDG